MTTSKATLYLQQLDSARCSGDWERVPECARKVQKHAPGRKCLTVVSITESKLHTSYLPAPKQQSEHWPRFLEVITGLENALQEELGKLRTPPRLPTPATSSSGHVTSEDIFQAKVTLAWLVFQRGDYKAVLEMLPEENDTPKLGPGEAEMEYTRVLLLKNVVLKGLSLELLSQQDQSGALLAYKAATRLPYTSALGAYNEGIQWAERALGRFAVVGFKCWQAEQELVQKAKSGEGDETSTLDGHKSVVDDASVIFAFRSFNTFMKNIRHQQASQERTSGRTEVYACYLKFLSILLKESTKDYSSEYAYKLRQNQPSPHAHGSPGDVQSWSSSLVGFSAGRGSTVGIVGAGSNAIPISREELKDELKVVETLYGNYLFENLKFPSADEVHTEILDYVDLIMQNWRNMGSQGEDARDIVDVLYRASTKTFHSPRIMRHLFITLTASGNFHDAALALNTYIDLVQRALHRIAKGGEEKDFDSESTVLSQVPEGIKLLAKYANDGKRALELADLLEKWITEWDVVPDDDPSLRTADADARFVAVGREVLAAAWRGIGIGNAAWARQTVEEVERADCQQKAIAAFRQGLEFDPQDVDALYNLAVALAETRAIPEAIQAVKSGLEYLQSPGEEYGDEPVEIAHARSAFRRRAVPMWHLLALLLSASQEYETAEKACEAAFELFGGEEKILRSRRLFQGTAFEKIASGASITERMTVGEKERLLEVKMTQIALVEIQEGPETAVNLADELLVLYRKLFESVPTEETNSNTNLVVVQAEKSRPTSRYSMFSRHKKAQSSIASARPASPAASQKSKQPPTPSIPANIQDSGDAPRIQVTDSNGASPVPQEAKAKKSRGRSSRSGSLRRKKSMASVKSHKTHTTVGAPETEEPKSASRASMDSTRHKIASSVRSHSHALFHHHSQHDGEGEPGVALTTDSATASPSPTQHGHNLPVSKLPHPARGLPGNHDESARSIARPPGLPEPTLSAESEALRIHLCLVRIWLLIAGLYRRAGMWEDASAAIEEASKAATESEAGDIRAERGFLSLAQGKTAEAKAAFEAALAGAPDLPQAIVGLAYIILDIPLGGSSGAIPPPSTPTATASAAATPAHLQPWAESRVYGLLTTLTKLHVGYDMSEAWFALGVGMEKVGMLERARECFWWCVCLEDSKPVRGWGRVGVWVS